MADFKAPHLYQVAGALTVFYIFYTLVNRLALWRHRQSIQRQTGALDAVRYPQRDRLFGLDMFSANIKALREQRFLETTAQRFQTVGVNTFQFLVLGRRLYTTIEPENLKTIQAVDHKKWSLGTRRKTAFQPLFGEGIFTTDGAAWQHSRDMLRPNFARSQVGDVAAFERHVAHLIAAIPADGRTTVDLSELFFRLTIDSATEFLFGESVDTLVKGTGSGFADAFNRSQEFISGTARWGRWAELMPGAKRFREDTKQVHEFVDYFVDLGLAKRAQLGSREKPVSSEASGRYVFIDELVRQTTDRTRIRSELLNILLAGRDTTASLLTNVWFVLARRPDIWAKLQAEVATLEGAKPSFERLKDLKYLRALMNESLRCHPVVPVNSREATEDTMLPLGGGPDGRAPLFVAKGTVVTCKFSSTFSPRHRHQSSNRDTFTGSVYAMHRRRDFYGADAEAFRPERWLDDAATGRKGLRPGWEYLPFNGGARICLGQQYALTEAGYTIVRLCQAFEGIESRDPQDWVAGLTLTCVSKNGAKVALTPRKA